MRKKQIATICFVLFRIRSQQRPTGIAVVSFGSRMGSGQGVGLQPQIFEPIQTVAKQFSLPRLHRFYQLAFFWFLFLPFLIQPHFCGVDSKEGLFINHVLDGRPWSTSHFNLWEVRWPWWTEAWRMRRLAKEIVQDFDSRYDVSP